MSLKILAITHRHPPYHKGGYEIRFMNLMHHLKLAGNEVYVISSNHKSLKLKNYNYFVDYKLRALREKSSNTSECIKKLKIKKLQSIYFGIRSIYIEIFNNRIIEKKINLLKPDIIYTGHIYPLSNSIIPFLSKFSIPIIHDEGGKDLKLLLVQNSIFKKLNVIINKNSVLKKIWSIMSSIFFKKIKKYFIVDWIFPKNFLLFLIITYQS